VDAFSATEYGCQHLVWLCLSINPFEGFPVQVTDLRSAHSDLILNVGSLAVRIAGSLECCMSKRSKCCTFELYAIGKSELLQVWRSGCAAIRIARLLAVWMAERLNGCTSAMLTVCSSRLLDVWMSVLLAV
jgi:hypothetical protein